jgi:glycosyltransferase involved in cell wall biosynthesis
MVGGAEKSVALLAEGLTSLGDSVSVICLYPGKEETVETIDGVRVHRLPLDNIYWPFHKSERPAKSARLLWHTKDFWNPRAAARVARILDLEKPDVAHTHGITGFSVAIWPEITKRNIRLVHTLRDYHMLCSPGTMYRDNAVCTHRCADCRLFSFSRKYQSRRPDAVVSISKYLLDVHRANGYFEGVPGSVIYNPCGSGEAPARAPVREDNTLIFGCVGRITPEKGIDVLLEATTRLANRNWLLRIAGSGFDEYVADLKQRYPDPRIEWVGFVEIDKFYASIDVSVISSTWAEPLSRVVLESFAAGKSAICARSGGIPEIAVKGKTFGLYSATDPLELAGLMDRALSNVPHWRAGGFIDEASARIFSNDFVAARYRDLYLSLATDLRAGAELQSA